MSYAGGQNYEGDSGEWGASGAYCANSYSSYMSAQYGALGESIANQQLGYEIPLSWYENDLYLQYAQYGAAGIGVGAGLGAIYLGAAAAGPAIYSYLSGFGTSAATSPELVAAGAGAAQYGIQNAPELESLVPEVSSVGAEGVTTLDASAIRFSQSSVTGLQPIVESMSANGWVGAPADVVSMNGQLITVDNTRVLAASLTNTPVQAMIHSIGEGLPESMAGRFGDAMTWGDAVMSRIGGQNALYQSLYPLGSWYVGVTP